MRPDRPGGRSGDVAVMRRVLVPVLSCLLASAPGSGGGTAFGSRIGVTTSIGSPGGDGLLGYSLSGYAGWEVNVAWRSDLAEGYPFIVSRSPDGDILSFAAAGDLLSGGQARAVFLDHDRRAGLLAVHEEGGVEAVERLPEITADHQEAVDHDVDLPLGPAVPAAIGLGIEELRARKDARQARGATEEIPERHEPECTAGRGCQLDVSGRGAVVAGKVGNDDVATMLARRRSEMSRLSPPCCFRAKTPDSPRRASQLITDAETLEILFHDSDRKGAALD